MKLWQKVVTVLAAIVVFCTTYALILPAITDEAEPTCGQTEHIHSELCYEEAPTVLACSFEPHIHTEECKNEAGENVCAISEIAVHTHTELCYLESGELCCKLPEIEKHIHSDACYLSDGALACEKTEITPHSHADECYDSEGNIVCEKTVVYEHQHTAACLKSEGDPTLRCTFEEHTHHEILCYLDPDAPMETPEEWEQTIPKILSGVWTEDLVEIAKSQIGYSESKTNAQTGSDGEIHGATRYGIWYGDPYGKWDTTFVSFCMYYAEIPESFVPRDSTAYGLTVQLGKKGLYTPVSTGYVPAAGDIVFFDNTGDGNADRSAIIVEYIAQNGSIPAKLVTVEGDTKGNSVEERTYEIGDKTIMGYAKMQTAYDEYLSSYAYLMGGMMMSPAPMASDTVIGNYIAYHTGLINNNDTFLLYVESGGKYYAIDGNSNAVQISVDANGRVTSDISDPSLLYWTFTTCGTYENQPTFYIQNVSTGKYMHPYADSATNHGAILTGRWESALYPSGSGIKIRGARQNAYAYLQNNSTFTNTGTLDGASTFYLAKAPTNVTVWLDGTLGGLMSMADSDNTKYTVLAGNTFTLPESWKSPGKYSYKLQGWYDVVNNKYYAPGSKVVITDNTVFYADWIAATYDIGQYNSLTTNTVSTNEFITNHVFDYGYLFNVQSSYADVTVDANSHSETWNYIANGNSPYTGENTLNFVFRDWDSQGDISYPQNHDSKNTYQAPVNTGIYNERMAEVLFSTENAFDPETGEGIIGKTYLGTGDYLFRFVTDPQDEHYGYYFYSSSEHAASYNQSEQRFYVYDYLERTSDSGAGDTAKYSDFLPLNSPYVNTDGNNVVTYTYNGENGEYAGLEHYQYDAKYNSNGSAASQVHTNYLFGMAMDVNFYIPDKPGSMDENGEYGNRDLYGEQMHFKFSGDDDVWVFVDGELVLDIGGIHGILSGDVNFSTGVCNVEGEVTGDLTHLQPGDHVLTIYYLERGSSQSNCELYFNLAPRFGLDIRKEDVLSQELLNGAEFSVFTDKACTIPATLWESKEAHLAHEPSTNTFTVTDGHAKMWGFGAGNTYYIKETKPPDDEDYGLSYGIVCVTIDKKGTATYSVEVISDETEDGKIIKPSNGFTVHGFKIDEENQQVYIVITNAEEWVVDTTTVETKKIWNDDLDHTYETVTVYLTVTDPDGTVRRIREIALGEDNDWEYMWTSLPKYYEDGITEVQYGVEEAYIPGYSPSVEKLDHVTETELVWGEAVMFESGKTYILKSADGCLSTDTSSSSALKWVDEETAKTSPLARWEAIAVGSGIKLTNEVGQVLTFNYSMWYSNQRYFYANTNNVSYQTLNYYDASGKGIYIAATANSTAHYFSGLSGTGNASISTSQSSALVFTPMTEVEKITEIDIDYFYYKITNTPLETETAVKVFKKWDLGTTGTVELYERAQVTVKLFANGKDTGRTVTLSLKNGWEDTFLGLPYEDGDGNVITYTVVESWDTPDWKPSYSDVVTKPGDPATYEVTVTNTYRWGFVHELPATGGNGYSAYIALGSSLVMLAAGLMLYKTIKRRRGREGL